MCNILQMKVIYMKNIAKICDIEQTNFNISDGNNINNCITVKTKSIQRKKKRL